MFDYNSGRLTRNILRRSFSAKSRNLVQDDNGEQPKRVLNDSIRKASQRCLVHIIPVCTTILILVINIKGVFIGSDFVGPIKSETINLMLLQISAKIHELLIVASLGLIVLQMVRHELLFGDGLPLGLIGSGLNFSNIGFFFKKEFYGALRYVARGSVTRKICFLTILILAGLTAALAGPTSAVLLVPRIQTWPSGGTPFYLNGSSEDFWPTDLSVNILGLKAYCNPNNSADISICPGAGYQSLSQHWTRMNYTNYIEQEVRSYAKELAGSRSYRPVRSPDSMLPSLYALGDFRKNNHPASNTFWVQTHAAVATVLQRIADDWWSALVNDQKMDASIIDDRQISALFVRTPLASVRCSDPQNLTITSKMVQFPTIDGRFTYSRNADMNITQRNVTVSDHMRFSWVHLPDYFGAASIGGIFESPWTANNQSRVVIGCTAQLGWIPTTLYTDKYTFWTGWYPWNLQFGDRTPAYVGVPLGAISEPTNGRVAVNDEWLELLTPPAPLKSTQTSNWQPTTIESIMSGAGFDSISTPSNGTDLTSSWLNLDRTGPSRTTFLEAIIASVLADGLSRTGSHRVFDRTGAPPQWSLSPYEPAPDFSSLLFSNSSAFIKPDIPTSSLTTLRADMLISGFAFQNSLAGYLSISVLLVHLLMASIHTVWVLFHRHSSWSWSSISELITLSQNSGPTVSVLKNTGAGIEKAVTYSKIAKIRVRPGANARESDCVELVFEEDNNDTTANYKDDLELSRHFIRTRSNSAHGGGRPRLSSMSTSQSTESARPNAHLSVTNVTEMSNSRSSSTERLIPRAYLSGQRLSNAKELVRVNHIYG